MKASIIHITDHAVLRWKQRVSNDLSFNVYKIIEVVKKSRVISKKEIIPYTIPRQRNIVYSIHDDIIFVLEPISIDEFNLVTVIKGIEPCFSFIKKPKKIRQRFIPLTKKKRKKLPARNKRVDYDD